MKYMNGRPGTPLKWSKFGILTSFVVILAMGGPCARALPPPQTGVCISGLTPDERYQAQDDEHRSTSAQSMQLINETFTPFLESVAARLNATSAEDLRELARHVPAYEVFEPNDRARRLVSRNVYDGLYPHSLDLRERPRRIEIDRFGATAFNLREMQRLGRAMYVAALILEELPEFQREGFQGSQRLLAERTYAGTNMNEHMSIAHLTILQTLGQMSADPADGLSASRMIELAMTPKNGRPSAAVMFALMMPPEVLGHHGSKVYVKDAMSFDPAKGLGISEKFRNVIRDLRAQFSNREVRNPWELGHGCPVAHVCGPERAQSALQTYLDAIHRIYSLL